MRELPALAKQYPEWKEQGLEIISVNFTSQDSAKQARNVRDRFKLPFPVLLDPEDAAFLEYSKPPFVVPYFLLVDASGVAVHKNYRIPHDAIRTLLD